MSADLKPDSPVTMTSEHVRAIQFAIADTHDDRPRLREAESLIASIVSEEVVVVKREPLELMLAVAETVDHPAALSIAKTIQGWLSSPTTPEVKP